MDNKTIFIWLNRLGIGLILAGALSLCALAFSAYQIVKSPEEFPLAREVLTALETTKPLLAGKFGDDDFVLDAAEPLRYVFFGFIGLFLVSMMASISRAMILGGISLTRFAAESIAAESIKVRNDRFGSYNVD